MGSKRGHDEKEIWEEEKQTKKERKRFKGISFLNSQEICWTLVFKLNQSHMVENTPVTTHRPPFTASVRVTVTDRQDEGMSVIGVGMQLRAS